MKVYEYYILKKLSKLSPTVSGTKIISSENTVNVFNIHMPPDIDKIVLEDYHYVLNDEDKLHINEFNNYHNFLSQKEAQRDINAAFIKNMSESKNFKNTILKKIKEVFYLKEMFGSDFSPKYSDIEKVLISLSPYQTGCYIKKYCSEKEINRALIHLASEREDDAIKKIEVIRDHIILNNIKLSDETINDYILTIMSDVNDGIQIVQNGNNTNKTIGEIDKKKNDIINAGISKISLLAEINKEKISYIAINLLERDDLKELMKEKRNHNRKIEMAIYSNTTAKITFSKSSNINGHMIISGTSGMGKTSNMMNILFGNSNNFEKFCETLLADMERNILLKNSPMEKESFIVDEKTIVQQKKKRL